MTSDNARCGKFYRHPMIVIYDSRIVLTRNCPNYDSRDINYYCREFIRLATGEVFTKTLIYIL